MKEAVIVNKNLLLNSEADTSWRRFKPKRKILIDAFSDAILAVIN